jgi:hypothetical protein
MKRAHPVLVVATVFVALIGVFGDSLRAQLQQSGGPGSTVTIAAGAAKIGTVTTDQTTHGTSDQVAADLTKIAGTATATGNGTVSAGVQRVSIASDNTAFTVNAAQSGTWNVGSITTLPALVTGSAIIGFVRQLPAGCTQTTRFSGDTVGVATSTGSTVTSTTTCLANVFVNNITNSAVTFRLADKAGTPVIWVGGNADFSIPANSNLGFPFLAGITMTSGITAIAGTGSALNLHVEGWQ